MHYIKNKEALLSNGNRELRRLVLQVAEAGLRSADPNPAVRECVDLSGDTLRIGARRFDLSRGQRIFVIGAGKASYPIAKALDELVGPRIHKGLITCKSDQEGRLDHIALNLASHPLPDENSLEASRRTVELLKQVHPDDIVLAAFTGGSSSLFVSPAEGISLADKTAATRILLTCGANILEINAVRKHLSTVKGGRLVRSLPPGTHLVNLTVSDVIGDPLDYICDPSVPDTSSFADARRVLDRYDLWPRLPAAVAAMLLRSSPEDETVRANDLAHIDRTDIVLVKMDAACAGAAEAARRLGFTPMLLSTLFEGESSALGRNMAAIARQIILNGSPASAPCLLIGGGETTVTVNGSGGQGGPNQEFVAGAALELAGVEGVAAVGLDTDGTDGPTPYAGALADGATAELARRAGFDLHAALRRHDVSSALGLVDHLVVTGATGTNVNDLKLVLVNPGLALGQGDSTAVRSKGGP